MLVNFALTVGMFGGQLLVPVFLQSYRGLGAAETGLITMFQALAMLPLMPIVCRLADRFGTRTLLLIGRHAVAAVARRALSHGGTALQAQAEANECGAEAALPDRCRPELRRKVFMIAALITLLAIVPALFIGGRTSGAGAAEHAVVME